MLKKLSVYLLIIYSWLLCQGVYASCPTGVEESSDTVNGSSINLLSGAKIGYKVLKNKDLTVAVWYPSKHDASLKNYVYNIGPNEVSSKLALDAELEAYSRYPVVIYSHGAVGSGLSSFFLCEALARKGYVVFAPDFSDAIFASRIDRVVPTSEEKVKAIWRYIYSLRDQGLYKNAKSGRKKFAYRPKTLIATIELVKEVNNREASRFFQKLNLENLGLIGHSFGAWTSLLVAGAEPTFKPSTNVEAVVSLSGPVNESVFRVASSNDLALIRCPIMFQFGEKEKLFADRQDDKLLYQKANKPKYLACIADCNHFTFSCGSGKQFSIANDYLAKSEQRRAICNLTIAFFDRYLKGRPLSKILESVSPGVKSLKSKD